MTKRVSFLHTSSAHVDTFETLLAGRGLSIAHVVKPEWLAYAQELGVDDRLVEQIHTCLTIAVADADIVVCTCSTLGATAAAFSPDKVIRVDAPMMQRCVQHEGVVALAVCLESTIAGSTRLLERAFSEIGKTAQVEVFVCETVWRYFEEGAIAQFNKAIATQLRRAYGARGDIGCIALAQVSMAGVVRELSDLDLPIYASPTLAVDYVLRRLQTHF